MTEPTEIDGCTCDHVRVLGVDYLHLRLPNQDDLYVTKYGVPYVQSLFPENWREETWFYKNREKLPGSSTVYRVPTRPVNGRSKDLVVKWCRVGQDIPADTMALQFYGEFNSPFEEFSFVFELRSLRDPKLGITRTHKPLAIFCPAKHVELWRTGRKDYKFNAKKAKHLDIELDACRHYLLVYEWIKGVSVTETRLPWDEIETFSDRVYAELAEKGFEVADQKPHHIIVRPGPDGLPKRGTDGKIFHALIDFELLARTPARRQAVEKDRRSVYLRHQADRFEETASEGFPEHLKSATVLGVPYIFGPAESTRGRLWVVGRDPELFDYFLPERWLRTRRERLSKRNKVYHTVTKDGIHLVWKVSRLGELPLHAVADPQYAAVQESGYNSPFEEFSYAMVMLANDINVIYPRAIYMSEPIFTRNHSQDFRRFESHEDLRSPDGATLLSPYSNYICLWGFWNGPDQHLAECDGDFVTAMNLADARENNVLSERMTKVLIRKKRSKLERLGLEDLNLSDHHLLISLATDGTPILDATGTPELRVCNLDLVRRVASAE